MVSFAVRAAAVLALVSYVQATNLAIIKNHCNAPVYLWSVGTESSEMMTLASHGLPYFEQFQTREDGGWVIKIASDAGDFDNITQFEYTYQPGSAVWYDISNINGYPFVDGGMDLSPSVEAQASCEKLSCPPGAQPCDDAYNNPDDIDTHACPEGTDLTLVLCPDSSDTTAKRDAAPEASPEASPEAAAEPVPHAQGARHLHAHQRRARRGTLGHNV